MGLPRPPSSPIALPATGRWYTSLVDLHRVRPPIQVANAQSFPPGPGIGWS